MLLLLLLLLLLAPAAVEEVRLLLAEEDVLPVLLLLRQLPLPMLESLPGEAADPVPPLLLALLPAAVAGELAAAPAPELLLPLAALLPGLASMGVPSASTVVAMERWRTERRPSSSSDMDIGSVSKVLLGREAKPSPPSCSLPSTELVAARPPLLPSPSSSPESRAVCRRKVLAGLKDSLRSRPPNALKLSTGGECRGAVNAPPLVGFTAFLPPALSSSLLSKARSRSAEAVISALRAKAIPRPVWSEKPSREAGAPRESLHKGFGAARGAARCSVTHSRGSMAHAHCTGVSLAGKGTRAAMESLAQGWGGLGPACRPACTPHHSSQC